MTTGTHHFLNKTAAIKYYRPYCEDLADTAQTVNQKLKEGSIAIGAPKIKEGEQLKVNEEGRYFIVDNAK